MANNVCNFGAVGDGISDDTISIQNAINDAQAQGRPVFLPAGEYRITKTLTIERDVDLFGEDSNLCSITHDLRDFNENYRRLNATCIRVDNTPNGERTQKAPYVTLRRFRISTSEPRLILGDPERQTGIFIRGGFWNCIIRDVVVQDFFQGIYLRQCWTARIQNCSIERSLLHCLKWENATAGEITGCRLDCISGSISTNQGNACAFVTFDHVDCRDETIALSVANNAFQQSERAGFYGRGIGNVTFTNNFFEGNNRAKIASTAALHLDNDPGTPKEKLPPQCIKKDTPETLYHQQRVVNIIGGFFTPGGHGGGTAIKIGNYEVINIMGVDIRGSDFSKSIDLTGKNSKVNLVGVHAELPYSIRSQTPEIQNSLLGQKV